MNQKIVLAVVLGLVAVIGVMAKSLNKTKVVPAIAQDLSQATLAVNPLPAGELKDPTQGGHVGANGIIEELLTGELAEKARAAALEAVPGGTILKVETDAEGSAYEAHMTKPDGLSVTVKFDENFKVTKIEEGYRK